MKKEFREERAGGPLASASNVTEAQEHWGDLPIFTLKKSDILE